MERLFVDMSTEWEEERGRLGPDFWIPLVWDTSREAAGEWLSLVGDALASRQALTMGDRMSAVWSDVRFAVRQLRRQPLYSVTIVLLMALSIAGNAAVFRVFNGLFLKPLPFEQADRLVDVDETAPAWDLTYVAVAYRDFDAWRDASTLEAIAAFEFAGGNFLGDAGPQRISYLVATHDIDDVLRLDPALGRFFGPEEDRPDAPGVMLLSQGFWAQQFASDPAVVGRSYSIDGSQVEVIGILPPEAGFLGEADVWMPLRQDATQWFGWGLSSVARLADGATLDAARAELKAIHEARIPEFEENAITSPVLSSLRDRYLGAYRLGSGFLLGAVAVVLLIACANIAGLMTVRSFARASEMAVRVALGAPRRRIVGQLLTEGLVLGSLGGVLGVAIGVLGSSLLANRMAEQFPRWIRFDLDVRFLLMMVLAIAGSAVLFALVPALRAARRGVGGPGVGARATPSGARRRAVGLLVTGEVALALALLVVGCLSVLDVRRLGSADPGFDPEELVTFSLSLPAQRYPDDEARRAFTDAYLERLEEIPGVTSAAVASSLPLGGHWGWFFAVDGAPARAEGEATPVVLNRAVSPSYFQTAGVDIVAGRAFDAFDGRGDGGGAIIVNESFVRSHLYFLDDPIGARLHPGTSVPAADAMWMTVVGVARDVRHYGVDEPARPGVYQPVAQLPLSFFQVALRVPGDPGTAVAAARAVTAALDAELPLFGVQRMVRVLDDALWTRRATSWLIGIFSTIALLMAVAGVYGVISYTVSQRRQEISIRMAMGAAKARVLREVVSQGMVLVAIGTVIGLAAARGGAGLVSGLLVEVSATNPAVYAVVTAIVLAVAGLANYLPARKAAALEPARALRGE